MSSTDTARVSIGVGLHIGPFKAETFWAWFLKSLVRRGLRGTKLMVFDADEGRKVAIYWVMGPRGKGVAWGC